MGLRGNLDTMELADLLQWLSLGQKTGALVVSSGTIERRIYFRNGKVIASASNDPREYLSGFLLGAEHVAEVQIREAIEARGESRMLLGKALVMLGAIGEEELTRILRRKAEEEIFDLFLWKEGGFEFLDNGLPEHEIVPLQIDLTRLMMEGTRRKDEWRRIEDLAPCRDDVPVIEAPVDLESLSTHDRLVVQYVNGHRSVSDVIEKTHSSFFLVGTVLARLAQQGILTFSPPASQPAASPPPSDDQEVASLLARGKQALSDGDFEKSLRFLNAARSLSFEDSVIRNTLRGAETLISSELKKEGITLSRIPRLVRPLEEMTGGDLSSNEGFILSRINGIWDVGSILKISSMRETELLLIFRRLLKKGLIEF